MAAITRKNSNGSLASFEVLVRKVRETILVGQQRIEQEKVQTYWKTGQYINRHILLNKNKRADFGDRTIAKLAERVGVHISVLRRCKLFAEKFPISAARHQLTWTHFRTLLPVEDDKTRLELTERANRGAWSTDKLESVIRSELRYPISGALDGDSKKPADGKGSAFSDLRLLKPKLGVLYTYRLIESKPVQANPGRLKVDLGFRVHQIEFTMRGELKAGQVIESRKQESGSYSVVPSKREESALYTYKAWVERAVDGDTQFVEIDLGFSTVLEQYLRLREIDCPEINTREGKKAKAFVEKCLKSAPYIFLTSSRSDKYDRYLSDVFIPLDSKSTVCPSAPAAFSSGGRPLGPAAPRGWRSEALVKYEGEEYLYLNNELLLRGLAKRMNV